MEGEKDIDRLERLESSVERLLAGYNTIRVEKTALEQLLESKNNEINGLQETIAALKGEKSAIHQRVSGLLSSIEEWEESQTVTVAEEVLTGKEEDVAGGGFGGATLDDPQLSMMSFIR
ncbi:MAG: cell division protein ZapB [Desulfobulbaceae bacterium]|nr:cell division protein ZapB [Desulfobulbaceae bacterium]